MATGGSRVHPLEEMDVVGTSMAASTSSYGGIHLPRLNKAGKQDRRDNSSSLEQAYWTGMRRRMGLSRLDHQEEMQSSSDRQYEKLRKDMAVYVERNFHQHECMKFIPKPVQPGVTSNKLLKCHCGEILSFHVWGRSVKEPIEHHIHEDFLEIVRNPTATPPEVLPKVDWNYSKNVHISPTHSFGKMSFNVETSGGRKPAKYLRLSCNDSIDSCLEFMEVFWHIMEPSPPNLVISVVGGAKNFRLDGEMRETFSNGIIKAAKTTNAWLITSGFNMGVMKAVGQAVQEGQAFLWDNDRMTHLLRCIAIAPWGYIYNRRVLEGRSRMGKFNGYYRSSNIILHGRPVSLNPDHTHFIFVDDGFRNRYGGVADFRAGFERKLCTPKSENGYGIPVVMIVVEGGPDAIHDVYESLRKGIPVVVCTGTGRAADFLTYAHKFTFKDRNGERTMNERQRKTLEDRVANAYNKNWGYKAEEELEKTMHKIDECMKRADLMIFFDLRREEDLDVAILSVLTKAETTSGAKHRLNQLELALTWNRADIAQSEIFREDVNWDPAELYYIMTKALKEDKMNFVRLLLNQGVSMKEYLTLPRLEDLYNSIPKHGYLHLVLKRYLGKEEFCMQDLGIFLKKTLDRFDDEMYTSSRKDRGMFNRGRPQNQSFNKFRTLDTTDTEGEEDPQYFKKPYKQLMIWAVLLNRQELAKFFWEMGEEPITSALSASLLCAKMHRYVPKYLHSVRQDFLVMKKRFEELATRVLDECHAVDPEKAIMLVERKSPSWSRMTCMQIAASANGQHFMSSVACQNSVNNVWKNGILSDWKRVAFSALIPLFILPVIHVIHLGEQRMSRWQKVQTFLTAPITKFFYHMLSYILFLAAYTYMLLVDFQKYPSPLEIFLMLWVFTIFIGEIHTFIAFPSSTFWGKVRDWFTLLNRLDMGNLLLAFIGFALRSNSDYYMQAKTIYCINAVIYYIRIMKVYIANSHLGPKLYMIFRMVEELVMFVVVLVVFLLAYGVCSQGLLYKRRGASFQVVKDIIQFPYWQLYGEIFLEEIQTDTDCMMRLGNGTSVPPYENDCRESFWLVYIMLGLYLLVGNVLLLNLLIAIFSHVFNMVEENSIEIWKYQMYFLVMEFQCKVRMPPPLSIFQHIYFLVLFIANRFCCKTKKHRDQFAQHHLMYLALFEKEMMANYLRRIKSESMDSMHRRFTKLHKRVDMLNKMIEDRHVEDELAMQASLRLGDGLRVLNATVNRRSNVPDSTPVPSLAASSVIKALNELRHEDDQPAEKEEGKEEQKEEGVKLKAEQMEKTAYKPGKEPRVMFALDLKQTEGEKEATDDDKKKKHKKKKKKERRQKSKERDSSLDKKVLNINLPEVHSKLVPDKNISDENNDLSADDKPSSTPWSKSSEPALFQKRTPPSSVFKIPPLLIPSAKVQHIDVGDEPDGESEVEAVVAKRSPKRTKSRGQLNMLSHSELKAMPDEEETASSSDGSFRPPPPPPHHRPRKAHRKKPPPAADKSDTA